MRYFLFISVFFSFYGYSQNLSNDPFADVSKFEKFNKEDSIDGIFPKAKFLLLRTDTIPIITMEESHLSRYLRVVNFYYDSMYVLRRVYYRNGQEGSYYFYFDDASLVKARFISSASGVFVFYFNNLHNELTISEIENKIENEREYKKFYEVLKLAQEFVRKWQELEFPPLRLTLHWRYGGMRKCSQPFVHCSSSVSREEYF